MELILMRDIEKLGRRGAVVKVADGYARNYLIPRRLAVPVTDKNRAALAAEMERVAGHDARLREDAQETAARLAEVALKFEKRCNESGELYGSVTAGEVAEAFAERGFDVDRKQVSFDEPITHIGIFTARLKLLEGVEAAISVTVVRPEE
jgi:large subunit ribosomal protein L9